MKRKEILRLSQEGYDLPLIARTQPVGNLKNFSRYLAEGDGYIACLRLYRYPSRGLTDFWGLPLVNNSNTMTVIDTGTEDRQQIMRELSRSATEKKVQVSGKAKEMDNITASSTYWDQLNLMKQLTTQHEVMKRVYWRIFVYAPTKELLEKRVQKIIADNSNFLMAVYVDEQLSEFKSIWVPTMAEEEMPNRPAGVPISARSLAGSYPFNHVKLEDPHGFYYGYTRTAGQVEFDPFQRDSRRTRSFFFVTGNPGMGKSTLLKKMNDDVFSRGAIIRNFDVSGEYTDQTRDQDGVVIDLASPRAMINPFEVFATVIDSNGKVDQIGSFAQHITKLKNFFAFLNPEATADDMTVLNSWLTNFYIANDLWVKNPRQVKHLAPVTGRPHDEYPTLSEWVTYANQEARNMQSHGHINSITMQSINRITSTFMNVLQSKGDMLDGVTAFPDLSHEQVVTFNLERLKAEDSGIFNAQVYSVLTLLSADIIKNGQYQRRLLKEGRLNPDFIKWYWINIDEAQNIITPHFSFGVEFLTSLMEQMRKNFCAVTMAAPTIKDLIHNGNSQSQYVQNVQKMFSMFQIRFFFQISDDDLPRLATALGGSTTEDELQALTKLEKTECLMNINGDRNVQFKVDITREEERRYGGGI